MFYTVHMFSTYYIIYSYTLDFVCVYIYYTCILYYKQITIYDLRKISNVHTYTLICIHVLPIMCVDMYMYMYII